MRILITGANGQLGRALQRAFVDQEVLAFNRGQLDLDTTDRLAIRETLRSMSVTHVINTAAMTDTAFSEAYPRAARQTNAWGPERLAIEAQTTNVGLFHVGTNEVFDGASALPYAEDERANPLNTYASSKLEGEVSVRSVAPRVARVIRTAWLYGDGGGNFVEKVLAAARTGSRLRFVTDEIATPTYVDDLAQAIRQLIEREAPVGIYHLTNEGEASRYEWACEILRLAGMGDVPAEPITTEQLYASGYDGPRKPRYSVLANTRARALGITMRDWREALADYFAKSRVAADA